MIAHVFDNEIAAENLKKALWDDMQVKAQISSRNGMEMVSFTDSDDDFQIAFYIRGYLKGLKHASGKVD